MSDDNFYMSTYQPEIEINLPKKVWIFDTTLRDGEQMPGVTYTIDEKLQIARQLDILRVPKIEAGFPITSKGETEAVKQIAALGLDATVCALARPLKSDIDRALERIADGSYGICQDCGLPIPAERLLLLPATPLCVHCKAREERMQPGPDEAQPRGVSQDHGLSLGESRSAVQ